MSFIGRDIGPYHVVSLLGKGGMGEVYRARDTKLGREVAIKVLPSAFTADPDRLARFQREARLLASLNHRHIGAIYGSEDGDGIHAIVLELVEGDTLAGRIARGRLSMQDALAIAREISEALEAAHEKGIVHRDLKPANIKITPDGVVKVLDFGLAKAASAESGAVEETPTMTAAGTHAGLIFGTPAYMSPEQARGKPVDKRTDIWAFGCVLYEMLAGYPAFAGPTISDTIAAVIEREPDWSKLPPATPAPVRHLLRRCLEKDLKKRLRDIGDAFSEPEHESAAPPVAAARADRRLWRWSIGLGVLVIIAVAASFSWRGTDRTGRRSLRFTIRAPADQVIVGDAVPSPDGRQVAFAARGTDGTRLWVQSLESNTARQIQGTDGAVAPFWSPDERFLGFGSGGTLKKADLEGGHVQPIAVVGTGPLGATWNRDGIIVVAPRNRDALFRVPAAGGKLEPVTDLDSARHENSHRWPHFLPDGRHFFYTARADVPENTGIFVGTLDSKDRKWVFAAQSNAVYVPPGYVLWVREGTLMGQRFDLAALAVSGEPFAVAGGVTQITPSAQAFFASSADGGTIAYVTTSGGGRQIAWFDRTGKNIGTLPGEGEFGQLRLAPDGKRAAMMLPSKESGNRDLWVMDLAGGALTRVTSHPANDWHPAWSADGSELLYASDRTGHSAIYRAPSNGAGPEQLVWDQGDVFPDDWSRHGDSVIFHGTSQRDALMDLWMLPLTGERKPLPVAQTSFSEQNGAFSPDGKWIAYNSNESGTDEVYVRLVTIPGKHRVSLEGGVQPRWRRDGRELFFVSSNNRLMSVNVMPGDQFVASTPRVLFDTCRQPPEAPAFAASQYMYDPAPDGQRFLFLCAAQRSTPPAIGVAVEWLQSIRNK